MKLFEATQN